MSAVLELALLIQGLLMIMVIVVAILYLLSDVTQNIERLSHSNYS